MLLKELKVRDSVFEPLFTGPDRTIFLEELNKRLIHQGPKAGVDLLAVLLGLLVGQDLYELGKALADLFYLDQHVKSVHKSGEESRREIVKR